VDEPSSPKRPSTALGKWNASGARPRLLNAAQWRQVIEQRKDLDDELRRLSMQETERRR
jgi:hypothetical protein